MQKATQAFFYQSEDDVDHFVAVGDVFADKDLVVKGRESFFAPVADLDNKK